MHVNEQTKALRRYSVDGDSFFAGVEDGIESFVPRDMAARCANAMNGIVERFGLQGATVLSLGSAECFEEYWFYKAGCRLTLNDLDSTGSFERYLQRLPAPGRGRAVEYVIGDAGLLVTQGLPDHACRVLYVSSFHPDEIRREALQADYTPIRPFLAELRSFTWRAGEDPYHPVLMQAADHVQPGGLAIFQHYRGGVNVATNPHYLKDVERQFQQHGLSLLEVFCFRKSPGHLLVVAVKDSAAAAAAMARDLLDRRPLTEFHGRHGDDLRKDIVMVYRAGGFRAYERMRLFGWLAHWYLWRLTRAMYKLLEKIRSPLARLFGWRKHSR